MDQPSADEAAKVFRLIRKLFEGSDGVESRLRAEALVVIDAIVDPKPGDAHDLGASLLFLVHCLEGGRWRMGQFFLVLDAHEFLERSLKILKGGEGG